MPYELIFVLLILAFAAFTQIMIIKAVRFGFMLFDDPDEAAKEPVFSIPKPKKKPKMTNEDKRTVDILANIDRYDGTSNGQVKVKSNG